MIGITGSNGKTTTTSLVEHILRTAAFSTTLAGNIGTPLISCVDGMTATTVTVVELSSFQLELIDTFRPDISVFLNLTPDHLDRHRIDGFVCGGEGAYLRVPDRAGCGRRERRRCMLLCPSRQRVHRYIGSPASRRLAGALLARP